MHMKWQRFQYTVDEFCDVIPDGQKADLLDGVIYVASPDSLEANDLFFFFGTIMRMFAGRKKLGKVFGSRAAFRLDERNAPEPDLAFVRAPRLGKVRGRYFVGNPDVAVEFVSPDSEYRDYVEKREKYRVSGVGEYWIVDVSIKKVTVLRLDARGRYRDVKQSDGIFRSEVLTGFWFHPEWFWADPLPDELDTYNTIIAAPITP